MQITVFAVRFTDGVWKEYQHICSKEEVDAVIDSASAKAFEQFRYWTPQYADYLAGARYIFNVARGSEEAPAQDDTMVYGVQIDDKTVRQTMDQKHLLARK